MKRQFRNESGQIIVILAIAMVALLGITALAIDGSIFLNDRRHDQSTADSAALAGAGAAAQILKDHPPNEFYCGSSLGAQASVVAMLAAQNLALSDNVALVQGDPLNGISVTCGTDSYRNYLDIRAIVTSDTPTTFARVLSRNQMRTTVSATSRVYPKETLAFGNGIASLSNSCMTIGGIDFAGSVHITVLGAGIFTNSCLTGSGTVDVESTGQISYYTGAAPHPDAHNFSPAPTKVTQRLPLVSVPTPNCTLVSDYASPISNTNGGTINPGNYSKIKLTSVDTLTMNPGLYCMTGDFTTTGQAHVYANGVTIYFNQGKFDVAGTSFLNMSAPNCETSACGVPPAIRGMLIYLDPNNNGHVNFTGTADSSFMGTIFAPGGTIDAAGSGTSVSLNTQLVANRVNVTGSAKITLNLDGAEIYQNPSSIELLK
ncbi:MAG: pilus assembly protein TadG-related protein [Chloroflexi bacterium]|nr:pilus assembly protein TadG-related protein [Chloroflexota bacterium]